MKFFVPTTKNANPESLYQALKTYNAKSSNKAITGRRIFRLVQLINIHKTYGEAFNPHWIESTIAVGEKLDKETILALFETSDSWYLIVTKSNGGLQGSPKWIPADTISEVEEFK
ncbi:hypothetical protein [Dehalogenimonas alkenigignens]|uniref:hypothetical protein n=1 Tax=Dehalogenimonas alkenigignens TaxID=1217799 RepID=UPI000D571AD0|nr:hypothetical protein [Dehalogenimonas alkenigignens]PVV83508.1 hypothetical protein DD509_06675 [Dehalogenimonas alkenigignens]